MLNILLQKIDENNLNIDKELVIKAYTLAKEAHFGQKRVSGEAYIVHPVEVAIILIEMSMDTATVAAGILHDVVEDTPYKYEDISRIFSEEIAELVDGVTKLGKIKYKTKEEEQADNVRKMLLAMAKDVRVILIKLADRLHNLRTLKVMPEEKQKEKAKETLNIYAPLAHRLGIFKIKWELEDLSFKYLYKEEFYDLVERIASKRVEREKDIEIIKDELREKLQASQIKTEIDGRPKHLYSIYKKMINKNKNLDQIFDLTAIRILVNTIKDCYATLGIVHTVYKPIPGRFKDYIAMPKPNMYQSLHTTVIGENGKPFEIQIRTFEMHRIAELGIAAHWQYKEGISGSKNDFENKLTWIREALEYQNQESNAREFMENFKIDLFSDEVFVFTPKGRVISLPSGSTPIDFAYRIHTDVGHRCVGAKVDGRIVSLEYTLKTGEIVEVITVVASKGPNINWLNIVKSNQAKSKIREWFKKCKRDEQIIKGKELLEKEAKRQGINFGDLIKDDEIDAVLKKHNYNNIDDIYVNVAFGTINAANIITQIENRKRKEKEDVNLEIIEKAISRNKKSSSKKNNSGIYVKGEKDILTRLSKCCSPIPGDNIEGYITKGRGVSIHRSDCTNLKALISEDPTRIVEVQWGNVEMEEFVANIKIVAEDKTGLLNSVVKIITDTKTNILGMNARTTSDKIVNIGLSIKVPSIAELNTLIRKIKQIKGVVDIFRINS